MPAAKKKSARAQSSPNRVKQGVKFGLVGVSNTVIDYTIYITVSKLLNVPLSRVYLVKFFSGTVAMLNSFYWNRRWVFPNRIRIDRAGARFLTATLVSVYLIQPQMVRLFSATAFGQRFGIFWFNSAHTLGLVGLAPHLLTSAFVIKTAAFATGAVTAAVWNYLLYRFWAFNEK
jgi:putative flippase GtrA